MSTNYAVSQDRVSAAPTGSAAAAILAAGIGSLVVAFVSIVADQSLAVKDLLSIYKPTGPLSGVTTLAILVWLAAWALLEWRWHGRDLSLKRINIIAFTLLALSLLATFPPLGDLL
jgi:anaerobic C4-dicarboxylate transporter